MNIAYYITPKSAVVYLASDSTLRQAIEKIRFHGFSAVPVLNDDGTYFGTVTQGDLLFATYGRDTDETEKIAITSIIDRGRYSPVDILSPIDKLVERLVDQNFVPVVDDRGYFMGIVTRRGMLEYYYKKFGTDK